MRHNRASSMHRRLLALLCAAASVSMRCTALRPPLHGRAVPRGRALSAEVVRKVREDHNVNLRVAAAATVFGLATVLALPEVTHAGFGAPTGAVTSAPPMRTLTADDIAKVSSRKLQQISGSNAPTTGTIDSLLNELQLRADQLTELADEVTGRQGASTEASGLSLEDTIKAIREQQQKVYADLERGRELKQQLEVRKEVTAKLEKQPTWYNYAAALCGSILSTLIMHPMDTIKTRYMAASPRSEAERSVEDLYSPPPVEPKVVKRQKQWGSRVVEGLEGLRAAGGAEDAAAGAALGVAASETAAAEHSEHAEHAEHAEHGEQAAANADAEGGAELEAAVAGGEYVDYSLQVEVYEDVLEPYDLKAVRKPSGIASLYEGLLGNILKEGPSSALYLGVYEDVKVKLLTTTLAAHPLGVYLLAGATGELIGSLVRAPMEAIKSNVQSGTDTSTFAASRRVLLTSDGRENVVRAWSCSIWRDVPFGAIQLAVFELTKTFILNSRDISIDINSLQAEAMLGAFAGSVGAFVSTPADVITTRIITQKLEEGERPGGILEMVQRVYDEGGPSAFFVGWKERVLYWAPAISLFLSCYCSVRQLGFNYFTD